MTFGGLNRDRALRALALVRRSALLAAIVLFHASGAWAQAIDVNRLVGLDPPTSEQHRRQSSFDPMQGAATVDAGGAGPVGPTVVEPIPSEQVPTTWLVRDESGSATLVCGRSGVVPEPGPVESRRGGERILK